MKAEPAALQHAIMFIQTPALQLLRRPKKTKTFYVELTN